MSKKNLIRSVTLIVLFFLICCLPLSSICMAFTIPLEQQPVSDFSKVYKQYKAQFFKSQFETQAEYEQRINDYFKNDPIRYFEVQISKTYDAETQTMSIWNSLSLLPTNCDTSSAACHNWNLPSLACFPGLFGVSVCDNVLEFSVSGDGKIYISNPLAYNFPIMNSTELMVPGKVKLSSVSMPPSEAQRLQPWFTVRVGLKVKNSPVPVYDDRSCYTSSFCSPTCCYCTKCNTDYLLLADLKSLTVYDSWTKTIYAQYSDNTQANSNCVATLSANLDLHIPAIAINNQLYWADFSYIPNTFDFNLTNADIVTDTSLYSACFPSTLSPAFELYIPALTFGGVPYWADFQYAHDLIFTLIDVGQN